MLCRLSLNVRLLLSRTTAARTAAGKYRIGLAATAAALGGAAVNLIESPVQAQGTSGWRITAPAAEHRAAEKAKTKSSQEGFADPPIVVTISGAAGQISYSKSFHLQPRLCLLT